MIWVSLDSTNEVEHADKHASVDAQTIAAIENTMQMQSEVLPQVVAIEQKLKKANPDFFWGIYFEGPKAVVQIVEKHQTEAFAVLSSIPVSNQIRFETVRYSQRELEEALEKLRENEEMKTEFREHTAVPNGIDTKNNTILVFTQNETTQQKILDILDPDMVNFHSSFIYVDQDGVTPSTI